MSGSDRSSTELGTGTAWTRRIKAFAVLAVAAGAITCLWLLTQPLVQIVHMPQTYPRRAEYFSANVSILLHELVYETRYRLDGGAWKTVSRDESNFRLHPPISTIEIPKRDLKVGKNRIVIEAFGWLGNSQRVEGSFDYDPSPIELPMSVEWKDRDLEAQDGYWEAIESDGTWWVRPKPGFEGYDRILVVSGAFAGGRRVTTEVILRELQAWDGGFGVLALWGGHPDDLDHTLRRGWSYALSWYWGRLQGIGSDISYKDGPGTPVLANAYRAYDPELGKRHHIVVEVFEELNPDGTHFGYRQRTKWWPEGSEEPDVWVDARDVYGSPLPEGEFSVALLSFWARVEFGPVHIEPLAPIRAPAALEPVAGKFGKP